MYGNECISPLAFYNLPRLVSRRASQVNDHAQEAEVLLDLAGGHRVGGRKRHDGTLRKTLHNGDGGFHASRACTGSPGTRVLSTCKRLKVKVAVCYFAHNGRCWKVAVGGEYQGGSPSYSKWGMLNDVSTELGGPGRPSGSRIACETTFGLNGRRARFRPIDAVGI